MKSLCGVFFAVMFLFGCGGGDSTPSGSSSGSSNTGSGGGEDVDFSSAFRDISSSNFYSSDNNTARLSGPVVGSGAAHNSDVSRDIGITYQVGEDLYLKVRRAYASVHSPASTAVTLVIQNISELTLCGINPSKIKALDINGRELTDFLYFYTSFSQGKVFATGRFTDTCLAPGEVGYLFTIEWDFLMEDVASVSVGSFGYTDTQSGQNEMAIVAAGDGVVPVSYQLAGDGSSIDIRVANRTDRTLDVPWISYMFLDEAGNLLYIDQLIGKPKSESSSGLYLTDTPLHPGTEANITSDIQFTGSASSVRVVIDYEIVQSGYEQVDVEKLEQLQEGSPMGISLLGNNRIGNDWYCHASNFSNGKYELSDFNMTYEFSSVGIGDVTGFINRAVDDVYFGGVYILGENSLVLSYTGVFDDSIKGNDVLEDISFSSGGAVFSARSSWHGAVNCYEIGMFSTLVKPFSTEQIVTERRSQWDCTFAETIMTSYAFETGGGGLSLVQDSGKGVNNIAWEFNPELGLLHIDTFSGDITTTSHFSHVHFANPSENGYDGMIFLEGDDNLHICHRQYR